MKKRVNNDLKQTLTINQGGSAEDFTLATNIILEAYIPNASYKVEIPFRRVNNIFYVYAPANTLKIGIYTYVLSYNKPDTDFESGSGTFSIDFKDAFEIVRHTEDEDEAGQHLTGIVSSALDGATFTPAVTDVSGDITLSWTNDREKTNPTPIILNEGVPEAVLAANIAATTANEAASNADTKAGLANLATIAANEAAIYAEGEGDYAKAQGDYAKGVGDSYASTLANKVDKVTGKQLSTEDYTTTEKNKLSNIAENANNYTHPTNHQPSIITQDTNNRFVTDAEKSTWNAKQAALVITADTTPVNTDELLSLRSAEWLKTTWTNVKVFLKTYFDTLYVLITDLLAIQPAVAFYKRVIADGGTVVDKSLLAKVYTEFNQSLVNTHCLYFPQIGIKERVSGINRYANKLYDLGLSNNDGVMATEATQPYIGGYIAPNEFRCLKYLQGQTQTGEITIPTKSYAATDSFTLFLILKANKRGTTRILTGAASYIDITATTIVLHNGISATLTGTHTYDIGKIAQIEFQYSNGTGLIKVNNVPLATTVISTTMSITRLAYSSTNPFDGSIYYYHLENVRISEADSQKRYIFLRSLIAEIEGIAIGNQFWQTSNLDVSVAANGTEIREIQASTSGAELITNAADRDFSSDTGNWTKGTGITIEGGVALFTNVADGQTMSIASVFTVGKTYKITYTIVSLTTGGIRLDGGMAGLQTVRTSAGTYTETIYCASADRLYIRATGGATATNASIDNVSITEAGWADLTSPAWCYYNNDPALGAVYGKLYNWYAVDLINKYAPQGFRVPTSADFTQLATFLGGTSVAGGKMKKEGLTYWNTPNTGATNESGFSALANGIRMVNGTFANLRGWSAIAQANTNISRVMQRDFSSLVLSDSFISGNNIVGFSLRLIRTSPTVPQRGVIRVSTTANIASTPVSIPIPFGCQVESIRIRNKQAGTNLTSVSATHNNTAGASLGTLITGKTVNAATSSIFVATQLDMASQETDGTVRVLATGNAVEGCDIEVTYKVMAL